MSTSFWPRLSLTNCLTPFGLAPNDSTSIRSRSRNWPGISRPQLTGRATRSTRRPSLASPGMPKGPFAIPFLYLNRYPPSAPGPSIWPEYGEPSALPTPRCFLRLANAVAGRDAKAALELVAELSADGVDLRRFVAECVGFFRGVFLAHYAPNLAEISDEPAEVYESWKKAAELIPAGDVLRGVDLLGEALVRIREGREERLMTELALIKLTRPETASDPESLIARMDRLERRMGKPSDVPQTW